MTTDQPAVYCPCNWRCHRETHPCSLSCLSHGFAPAPTPTSSLEEARTLAHNRLLNAILDLYDGGYSREDVKDWNTLIDNVYAVARAEVIREVEALGRAYSRNTGEGLLIATIVRALSQGGEGKSDG